MDDFSVSTDELTVLEQLAQRQGFIAWAVFNPNNGSYLCNLCQFSSYTDALLIKHARTQHLKLMAFI